jgi:hypothetical protein
MSQNPIKKAGQLRPGCLRVSYAQGLRSEASPKKWDFRSTHARKPFGTVEVTEGLQPISSEPAPSHRPWASAPGATPKRTTVRYAARRRTRTRTATEVSAPDAEASVSTRLPTRSLPKEDLGIPRRPVDHRCGANPAAAILDVPARGCDPAQIDFRLRQGGKALRVRLLSYVTQRSPFRLPR